MKIKSKIILICLLCSGLILTAGSFAFFTDYETTNISAKTSSFKIAVENFDISNKNNISPGDEDPSVKKQYTPVEGEVGYDKNNPTATRTVPTTEHKLTFSVTNDGSIAAKTRHTIVVSCLKGAEKVNPTVFHIYNNGTELSTPEYLDASGKNITDKDSAVYVKYVYLVPDALTTKDTETYSYDFSMSKEASGNVYAGSEINVSLIVEAMQNDFTETSDWEIVSDNKLILET